MKGLGGDLLAFWPEGLVNAPHDLVDALSESLTVLSWFENLPKDEQPPRHIWWSGDLLEQWFEDVRERRDPESRRNRRRSSYEEADDVPMADNELDAQMREAARGR